MSASDSPLTLAEKTVGILIYPDAEVLDFCGLFEVFPTDIADVNSRQHLSHHLQGRGRIVDGRSMHWARYGITTWWINLRRTATGKNSYVRVASDQHDRLDLRHIQWQHLMIVLEQHRALLRNPLRQFKSGEDIGYLRLR